MKDDKVYNVLLGVTITAILLILFLTIGVLDYEAEFTEVYFTEYTEEVEFGEEYDYTFVIHNLEGQTTDYHYTIYFEYDGEVDVVEDNAVTLEHDQTATITETIKVTRSFEEGRFLIQVNDQELYILLTQ